MTPNQVTPDDDVFSSKTHQSWNITNDEKQNFARNFSENQNSLMSQNQYKEHNVSFCHYFWELLK